MGRFRPLAVTRQFQVDDKPEIDLDDDDWIEWGGDYYWVAGFTAGFAPIEMTLEENQPPPEADRRRPAWARAKQVLRQALLLAGRGEPEMSKMRRIGHGLSRDVFVTTVESAGDDGGHGYVVLLPNRNADPEIGERTRREARLLARLDTRDWPLRVPEPFAVLPTSTGPALIRGHLEGVPADLRATRLTGVVPWELVGEIAAIVHSSDLADLDWLDGHATRRAHGEALVAGLKDAPKLHPVAGAVFDWLTENLPLDRPSVLLHGDLLGQNILLYPGEPNGLIDWEYATRGDPAYDLAIVTRGVRRPFQVERGLERLLEAYRRHGGDDVAPREVRFHELCMMLRWFRDEAQNTVKKEYFERLGALLRRVKAE